MVIHFLMKKIASVLSGNILSSKCVVLKKSNPSFKRYFFFLFELFALVFQYEYSSQAIVFRCLRLLLKNKKYVAWSLTHPAQ